MIDFILRTDLDWTDTKGELELIKPVANYELGTRWIGYGVSKAVATAKKQKKQKQTKASIVGTAMHKQFETKGLPVALADALEELGLTVVAQEAFVTGSLCNKQFIGFADIIAKNDEGYYVIDLKSTTQSLDRVANKANAYAYANGAKQIAVYASLGNQFYDLPIAGAILAYISQPTDMQQATSLQDLPVALLSFTRGELASWLRMAKYRIVQTC